MGPQTRSQSLSLISVSAATVSTFPPSEEHLPFVEQLLRSGNWVRLWGHCGGKDGYHACPLRVSRLEGTLIVQWPHGRIPAG